MLVYAKSATTMSSFCFCRPSSWIRSPSLTVFASSVAPFSVTLCTSAVMASMKV